MRRILNTSDDNRIKKRYPSRSILLFASAMIVFGAIMIFDASVYLADQPPFNDRFHFLKLHLVWLVIGFIPSLLIYLWDYRKFAKLAVPALIVNIILLIVVLFTAEDINGSRRWLRIGESSIGIQPAEFVKPVFIIYISSWLAKQSHGYKTFKDALRFGFGQKLAGFLITLGVVLVLIVLEPDYGTTLIVGATAFMIFFLSGSDTAHYVGSLLTGTVLSLVAGIAAIVEQYRLDRIVTYLKLFISGEVQDPTGDGYQVQQILIGIGSSGFWGKGFGQSRQRFGYLVENTAFTDSIFAVILEEMGVIGGLIFIGAWFFFLSAGMQIAINAPDRQGRLIAAGITIWLTLQALLNMAANVALIPLTGIPLPFITYGGSSTIVSMIGVAILLNISRFGGGEKRSV